jgi:hypothetical protein
MLSMMHGGDHSATNDSKSMSYWQFWKYTIQNTINPETLCFIGFSAVKRRIRLRNNFRFAVKHALQKCLRLLHVRDLMLPVTPTGQLNKSLTVPTYYFVRANSCVGDFTVGRSL